MTRSRALNALVAGSTTLVSDMSLSLADNASADEADQRLSKGKKAFRARVRTRGTFDTVDIAEEMAKHRKSS